MNTQNNRPELNCMVGATSIIFNELGEPFKQSRNLRAILEFARSNGVVRIHVDMLADAGRPGALVSVFYRSGDVGKVYFVDGPHAMQWACDKANESARRSWFAGCTVTHTRWPAGAWDWKS